jgi:AraC family transcriptional regulator of adaptative response/methylated-DNA-[protein]-cysteine methyltransferase
MLVTNQETIYNYYKALVNKEPSFVGSFFVGVKTTGIFCIATCRARKPKLENVEFYTELKEVLDNGYRPCKICRPTENNQSTPPIIEQAIALVRNNPKQKITDQALRLQQIQPEKVRRWFKKHYGITFQAYQRMYRLNNAFQELKEGKTVTTTAFDTGYESLSGFGYTYKKLLGHTPQNSQQEQLILINRLTTPLGPMFICATTQGICLLEFVERKKLETELKDLQRLLKARIIVGENEHIQQAKKELAAYFAGTLQQFEVALHTPGTVFQQAAWQGLSTIPYGQTISYKKQAQKLNKPTAVRAIAQANGANRVAIILPCHRVVGSDGALRGYAGGLERKRWLLEHEKRQKNSIQ